MRIKENVEKRDDFRLNMNIYEDFLQERLYDFVIIRILNNLYNVFLFLLPVPMKIIADENISFALEAFSGLGETELVNGRKIPPSLLKEADALVVRSTTQVNKELLEGTKIKFVGTATIGTDHIDTEYLNGKNIAFSSAAGCNSQAVAEYVVTAIAKAAHERKLKIAGSSIGIIGAGNIGGIVEKLAKALNMQVKKNDPPLLRKYGSGYCSLEEALACDFVTLHVPLNAEGPDKTIGLIGKKECAILKEECVFINASRGQVVNGGALSEAIEKKNLYAILDVWETEPSIDAGLLKKVKIGSPHIAGYTLEGKANGTKFIYDALCSFLKTKPEWTPNLPEVKKNIIDIDGKEPLEDSLWKAASYIYPIYEDDERLRKVFTLKTEEIGEYFDYLRKSYPYRREFRNYTIKFQPYTFNSDLSNILNLLGFNITE